MWSVEGNPFSFILTIVRNEQIIAFLDTSTFQTNNKYSNQQVTNYNTAVFNQ